MKTTEVVRKRINVRGIVQGVGFRPFIYNLADKYNLSGFVGNNKSGVEIEVEGEEKLIQEFINDIRSKSPPLSAVYEIKFNLIDPVYVKGFTINKSSQELGNQTFISPDVSICDDCKHELFDETGRRFLYPFINCTNCGPRFTIIENIPYDRKHTTMKRFQMCDECEAEYRNPLNRRFHAQPNACSKCGPQVWFESENETVKSDDAIFYVAKLLKKGKIVAIKGLGGFHIAVDASDEEAVKKLRKRKGREAKPFALMADDINSIRMLAYVNANEEELLKSYQKPIVLLNKKENDSIAENVAPGNPKLGVILPYTPLHYILFYHYKKHFQNGSAAALVMTSANYSEEPIAVSNEDAKERLSNIVDGFLLHDRDILIRSDDSVSVFINDKERIIRRSRGYIPKPVLLKENYPGILALGAELKNTICLIKDDRAFLSQHIGDLSNYRGYNFFRETTNHLQKIIDCEAEYFVRDLHPDYLSSQWLIGSNNKKQLVVQHHHAHMASCMTEHGINEKVIGIALDGTGLGYDNNIWGGEIFIGDYTSLQRLSHLENMILPGGDNAIKEPWRIAFAYIYYTFGENFPTLDFMKVSPVETIKMMMDKKINCIETSSTGRLFDAVAAIAGGPQEIRYEAEAAIHLTHAYDYQNEEVYEIKDNENIIPVKEIIKSVVKDVLKKESYSNISSRFHNTLVKLLIEKMIQTEKQYGTKKVVLSGGSFQNEVLLSKLENGLNKLGFEVYSHLKVPTNDGGISLGQAVIAGELINKGLTEVQYIN
ncbi:MAG: carbamoyltransferase HypF [Ignavibacteria bacterium]|jgi:hydrogenase maturation protein HypF